MQHPGAQVARGGVGAQDGHVAPGVAFCVGVVQAVGDGKGFFVQGGQADDDGRLAVAPAADGFDQRDALATLVVLAVVRRQQVGRDGVGGLQDLSGVAVPAFKPLGQPPLAAGHARGARTQRGNKSRHSGIAPCNFLLCPHHAEKGGGRIEGGVTGGGGRGCEALVKHARVLCLTTHGCVKIQCPMPARCRHHPSAIAQGARP